MDACLLVAVYCCWSSSSDTNNSLEPAVSGSPQVSRRSKEQRGNVFSRLTSQMQTSPSHPCRWQQLLLLVIYPHHTGLWWYSKIWIYNLKTICIAPHSMELFSGTVMVLGQPRWCTLSRHPALHRNCVCIPHSWSKNMRGRCRISRWLMKKLNCRWMVGDGLEVVISLWDIPPVLNVLPFWKWCTVQFVISVVSIAS